VVRRGLDPLVVGRTVAAVDVRHPRSVRRHVGGPEDFARRLVGRTVLPLRRRGKYLWWPLDDGGALLTHLGMTGQFRVDDPGAPDERHVRVRFGFADDGPEIRFCDQRMFGGLLVSPAAGGIPPEIRHIAPDPFDPAFDRDDVITALRHRRSGLKRALLDQTLVSGIGNIYADESLWEARMHGARPTGALTRARAGTLLDAVAAIMSDALAAGGTTFDGLYVRVNGESGYFDRSLRVYGREGLPCPRCGTPIVRERFMNRSSYFCPVCQRPPRRRR